MEQVGDKLVHKGLIGLSDISLGEDSKISVIEKAAQSKSRNQGNKNNIIFLNQRF